MHVFPMRRKVPDMRSSMPLSPDARTRPTRRSVLALPVLTGAGAVLAGCGALKKDGVASSGKRLGLPPRGRARVLRPHVQLSRPRLVPMAGWCSVRSIKVLR